MIASDSLEIDNDVLNTSGFPFSYKKFNISEFFFQHKDLLYKKKDELKRELSLIQQEYEKEREMVMHINVLVQIVVHVFTLNWLFTRWGNLH